MEVFSNPRVAADDTLDLAAFEAGLRGSIVLPGSPDYDEARQIQMAQHDRRPALIVRAADAGDVARTVNIARESGLALSVRGGSHSLAGFGTNDGGIVLDLGAMKGLHIDPAARVAWAQPGLTAGAYTAAAAAHGLATPFGDTGSVGIADLTLGGGIGWLVRKYGMAIDSLLAVEIATADGRQITASTDTHPDDDAVEALLSAMAAPSSPAAMIQIRVMGGAMARVPAEATAFAHRPAPIMLLVITPYEDPATQPAHTAWTVGLHDQLAANAVGVYSNFLEVEGDARIRAAYPAGSYERLAEIKRHYDPTNLFHLNQNIRPSVAVR